MSSAAEFTTTRWTAVFAASAADGQDAREKLALTYWYPLYVFARCRGLGPEDARDVVQTFLGRLLTGDALSGMTAEGGRFRDFLRIGILNVIRSGHRAARSTLRWPAGGLVSWDAEERMQREPVASDSPESAFDKAWARALLDSALQDLENEYHTAGDGELFEHLSRFLDDEPDAVPHADAARRLGLSEGTVKNSMTAFRRRFRQLLQLRVAATLSDPGLVEEELRSLKAALSS